MAEKIVRCPYCVDFDRNAFMPMIDCFGGRFICAKCGHVVMRESHSFRCRCRQCFAQDALVPDGGGVGRTFGGPVFESPRPLHRGPMAAHIQSARKQV
jgi:hypothetical protein